MRHGKGEEKRGPATQKKTQERLRILGHVFRMGKGTGSGDTARPLEVKM